MTIIEEILVQVGVDVRLAEKIQTENATRRH